MIEKIIHWANKNEDIRALILSGSRVDGSHVDELSDYDISVFCKSISPFIESDQWLSKIGTVWISIPEKISCDDKTFPSRLIIFENGIKVDFSFFPENILKEPVKPLNQCYKVLLDKDGITQSLPEPLKKPKKPSEEEFHSIIKEFWFEAYHVAKYLKREDLWLVKFRSGAVNEFLLTMIEWHAQTQNGWNLTISTPGKSMQSWVDKETWRELHKVFAHFDKKDSWEALGHTIALFRRLSIATASACGFRYLDDVDENINNFIESLK